MNVTKQIGQLSRRKLLKFSAGAVGTGALTAGIVQAELIEEGKLKVVGGYYDLDTGTITIVS